MSIEAQETTEMGTKPVAEHEWLKNVIGEWRVESEMVMGPDGETAKSEGTESVRSVAGLWAIGEGKGAMPDGTPLTMMNGLGYDVSFKEYRAFWLMSASSHLWKSVGTLSEDGKTMTLDCEGPSMTEDGKTAPYRDVIELIDADHRTLTSYWKGDDGEWQRMMKATYTRI